MKRSVARWQRVLQELHSAGTAHAAQVRSQSSTSSALQSLRERLENGVVPYSVAMGRVIPPPGPDLHDFITAKELPNYAVEAPSWKVCHCWYTRKDSLPNAHRPANASQTGSSAPCQAVRPTRTSRTSCASSTCTPSVRRHAAPTSASAGAAMRKDGAPPPPSCSWATPAHAAAAFAPSKPAPPPPPSTPMSHSTRHGRWQRGASTMWC